MQVKELNTDNIGIVAGEGELPRLVAESAKAQGYQVYVAANNTQAQRDLKNSATGAAVHPLCKLKSVVNYLHDNDVKHIVCIGKFKKLELLSQAPFMDALAWKYVQKLTNYEDNTFHRMVEEFIDELQLELLPQSMFLQEHFAKQGHYSDRQLTENEASDLEYGIEMARKASAIEVSQTVVVKDQAVMAFEAAEGTDQTIKRGCKYAKNNAVIVKVPWKKQSPYFDLPTIGPRTIATIAKHKGSVLAVESGKTFIIDLPKCIRVANQHGISLLSF